MAERIQLRRTRGWRKPAGAVVVARPSKWGNPYHVDQYRADWPDASDAELRRRAVNEFRALIEGCRSAHEKTPTYPDRDAIFAELAGRDLACWCPLGQPCHADVLLEVANEQRGS